MSGITLETDILEELTDDDIIYLHDNFYELVKSDNYFILRMKYIIENKNI
jgi:hypothetical protein